MYFKYFFGIVFCVGGICLNVYKKNSFTYFSYTIFLVCFCVHSENVIGKYMQYLCSDGLPVSELSEHITGRNQLGKCSIVLSTKEDIGPICHWRENNYCKYWGKESYVKKSCIYCLFVLLHFCCMTFLSISHNVRLLFVCCLSPPSAIRNERAGDFWSKSIFLKLQN